MSKWIYLMGAMVLLSLCLATGIVGGVLLDRGVLIGLAPPTGIPADAANEFSLMAQAWNLIDQEYVDRTALEPRVRAYGAIGGMVDALGDTGHSRFLTPRMVEESKAYASGQFEGIGAEVQMKDGQVVIVAPMDGSPAQKAGLRPGDVILNVDGSTIAGLPLDEVVALILGPAGTTVTLTVLHPGSSQAEDILIQRATIAVHRVTWARVPGTNLAHLRISGFSTGVTQDVQTALQEVRGQDLAGIILDLRNNPGGVLDEAVGVASQFLQGGSVLLTRDNQGQETPLPVQSDGLATDLPLAVLVNGGSASAAEVVAGAIQDAGRGLLIGETTFGTGTVLREYPLADGSALLLATEEWLTPKGRTIWHQGLAPDVEASLGNGVTPLLPEAEREMTPEALAKTQDAQLIRAIELLRAQ